MRSTLLGSFRSAAGTRVWTLALLLALVLSIGAPAVYGRTAEQRLDEFFAGLESLSADFTQLVLDEDRRVLQQSQGTLLLARPSRFRWDFVSPYRQEIVADGDRLWVYDVELAQVTVRPLEEALAGTPALLLSGNGPPSESFEVTPLGAVGELEWLELRPMEGDVQVESIRVALGPEGIDVMEVTDAFEQITSIRFTNVRRNPPIEPGRFEFAPPPGVDVIGDPRSF
jgi:outer membrane lipoprotein carrier protein